MNNLAVVHAEQEQLEQACDLLKHTLTIRQRVLGAAHPYTLNSANNLASILAALGRDEEANHVAPADADCSLHAEPT